MRRTGLLLAATALLMVALAGAALAATIDGDRRDNRLVGGEEADTIRGLGGNDTVYGRGDEDTLRGYSGDDTVGGGDGDDTIIGGPGRDTVRGEGGFDFLRMRDGVDGNDTAHCGAGIDAARVDSREDAEEAAATCETLEYRAEATGVVGVFEGDLFVYSPYYIKDEASGAFYLLYYAGVDLEDYVGRRVNVSGEVRDDGAPPSMYVERIGFAELEPAGR